MMGLKERIRALQERLPAINRDVRWQRFILFFILYFVVFGIVNVAVSPSRVELEVGRPSPRQIFADRDVVDAYTTEKLRDEAAGNVAESFDYDPAVLSNAEEKVEAFFNLVREAKGKEGTEEERILFLTEQTEINIDENLAATIIASRPADLREMQVQLVEILGMIMRQGIKDDGLDTARRQVSQEISFLLFEQDQKRVLDKLAQDVLEPNMIYNPEATQQAREIARHSIEPQRIMKGTLIVREGEIVTEQHIAQLESLGLLSSSADYTMTLGLAVLLLAVFAVTGVYLVIFQPETYADLSKLSLLGLIVVITTFFILAAKYFSGFLAPVAMGTILIATLLNLPLAIIMAKVFAVLVALMMGGDMQLFIVALLGGVTGVYGVSRLQSRSDLTKAGFYVSALNMVVITGLFLFSGSILLEYDFLRDISVGITAGVVNGLFSSIMAIGLLPFLESGFGLTTAVTLLELSNPNHPLLKKLLMEAPGTYHHSLIVANLSEAGAEAVGADPLLTRVGAFYHDVGKLKRPYFFIENQMGENPHQKISPHLSKLIITSHVKDGSEMAKKYNLPRVIEDIIQQHHGNSLVYFFYQQAAEESHRKGSPNEEDFRYGAPLPQSKEAAIILLADSVEAATRAMGKPFGGRIKTTVKKVIRDKLDDGQLDQSELTLKDLDLIAEAFVRVLSGVFHNRIEYPEKELKAEIEGGPKNGGNSEYLPE